LIVLATHGRTGLRRIVMGSVAEAVVRRASCPVLTLKPDNADFSNSSEEADDAEGSLNIEEDDKAQSLGDKS